tara:strand:- start:2014 stop:2511 length:498 start_codon:yes stop_codon:yes gene_type:complete
MATFFEKLKKGLQNITAPTVAASEKGDPPKTGAGRVTKNILTDLSISLGNTEGLSDEALADYRRRTDDAKQAAEDAAEARNERRRRRPPTDPTTPAIPAIVTSTPAAPPEMDMDSDVLGSAEEDVMDSMRKRKGRQSTIQTASQGLLSSAPTRRRRSLMGGGLIT